MTIEIILKPHHCFDGETLKEVINDIAEYCIDENDYHQKIISIQKRFGNGFAIGYFTSEIEKIQKDLDVKLEEAEQEYYNQLEEEDWREQEIRAYWDNR